MDTTTDPDEAQDDGPMLVTKLKSQAQRAAAAAGGCCCCCSCCCCNSNDGSGEQEMQRA